MTLDQAYEVIDGLSWKIDGMSGKLAVERNNGMTEVVHTADARGKRTAHYRKMRAMLGDDFTTTINGDSEEMMKIFGYVEMFEASYGDKPLG